MADIQALNTKKKRKKKITIPFISFLLPHLPTSPSWFHAGKKRKFNLPQRSQLLGAGQGCWGARQGCWGAGQGCWGAGQGCWGPRGAAGPGQASAPRSSRPGAGIPPIPSRHQAELGSRSLRVRPNDANSEKWLLTAQ